MISVIICTYNRCQELHKTLDAFCAIVVPDEVQWELLVVDNNSDDLTRELCREFSAKLPLVYHFEPEQGKSFALNTGMRLARGELFLFTDDDVTVDPHWIAALFAAYRKHPEKVFFGGRVLPMWEKQPPEWILQNLNKLPQFAHIEWGDVEKIANVSVGELFCGANLAISRQVYKDQILFPTNVGFLKQEIRCEDSEFVRALDGKKWQGIYVPTAIVYHRHPATRYSEKYLRKWHVGWGRAMVRLESKRPDHHFIFGAPRFLWRKLFSTTIKFIKARLLGRTKTWVLAECEMALTWGQIVEYRAERKGAP